MLYSGRLGRVLCTLHTLTLISWVTSLLWTASPRLHLDERVLSPMMKAAVSPAQHPLGSAWKSKTDHRSQSIPMGPSSRLLVPPQVGRSQFGLGLSDFYLSFLTAYIAAFKVQKQM